MELHGKEKFNSLYYKRLFEGIREFKANEYIPRQQFLKNWEKAESSHIIYRLFRFTRST